jgi:hypothetical protein
MELSSSFKGALRLFTYYYANGTLSYFFDTKVNYLKKLKHKPSAVEQIFAIYANTIRMDDSGTVLNHEHATKRATQYITMVCSKPEDNYKVIPEFEDWELELH